MLRTSRMCGRLRSVTGSSVRRLAAISGSASFLLPAGVISPRSGVPPSTTKRAIARKGSGSLRLEAEVGGDLVERRPVGLGVLGPCREGDDERVLPFQGHVLEERRVELPRSEEHTSELQSLRHLVCRLLLEKKKKKQ